MCGSCKPPPPSERNARIAHVSVCMYVYVCWGLSMGQYYTSEEEQILCIHAMRDLVIAYPQCHMESQPFRQFAGPDRLPIEFDPLVRA